MTNTGQVCQETLAKYRPLWKVWLQLLRRLDAVFFLNTSCLLFGYLLLASAPCLSHTSPSTVSPYVHVAVCLLIWGRSGNEEPLAARSGWTRMRGTRKSCSSGHLDWIPSIIARSNSPTFWITASWSLPTAQDRSLWRHFLASLLENGV